VREDLEVEMGVGKEEVKEVGDVGVN